MLRNNYFGEKKGLSENKRCPKTCFQTLKKILFLWKIGGVQKQGVTSIFSEKISPANDGLFVVDGLFVHEGLYVYVQLT